MSISDLILAVVVLAGIACVIWVMELNPYSKEVQVYTQTCDNMILDNSHCKGKWLDNPIQAYTINQSANQIISNIENRPDPIVFENCQIQDSKNWICPSEVSQENLVFKDGFIVYSENSDTRQITRLEWLQNKFLEKIY